MKAILFTAAGRRSFQAIPANARTQVQAKLDRYAATGAGDTKKLVGTPGVRLRSGDYRVIFIETETTIEVIAAGDRRQIYR